VELATYAIPEVFVCFGNKVYRGNRSKKISIERFESFDSPNYPPLATIGLNVYVNTHYILRRNTDVQLKPSFYNDILVLRVFPGLDPRKFIPLFDHSFKAIILEGFGAGNLPDMTKDWIDFISVAVLKQKLVYIGSQSSHGRIDLQLYSCGQQAEQAGALSLGDMTIEAALVKLMILLANFEDLEKVKKYMMVSLAGEIT
jgi:L-asparaginase